MKIIQVPTPIIHSKIKHHTYLKEKILSIIKKNKDGAVNYLNSNLNDSINKLDFEKSDNFEREWVKILFPCIKEELTKMILFMGLKKIIMYQIWYQQYNFLGRHGWHTHGSNYTGVYYLEFDKDKHPKTEIIMPCSPNEKMSIEVDEGDIVIFPSYFIHRSDNNTLNKTKTIVSFNIDLIEPNIK